jgi:hypothetical protein
MDWRLRPLWTLRQRVADFRRITRRWCCLASCRRAARLLALLDDFIITNFNAGTTVTFPMYVWGAAQRGIPPQVNVIGTAMFVIALLLVLASSLRGRRAKRPS